MNAVLLTGTLQALVSSLVLELFGRALFSRVAMYSIGTSRRSIDSATKLFSHTSHFSGFPGALKVEISSNTRRRQRVWLFLFPFLSPFLYKFLASYVSLPSPTKSGVEAVGSGATIDRAAEVAVAKRLTLLG